MRWWCWLIERVALLLCGQAREIFNRDGSSKYLSRFYLIGGPFMKDGSSPYQAGGHDLKPGAIWPNRAWGLYFHRFHTSDDAGDLHSHPWRWAVSLILSGSYVEERYVDDGFGPKRIRIRRFRAGSINRLDSDTFHRVDLVGSTPCWTLFLVGPKFSTWGFRKRDTGCFVPWREYINAKRDPVAFSRDAK